MAGYYMWSMSNNARAAYNRGLMPLSKWSKKTILDAIKDHIESDDLELQFDFELLNNVKLSDLKRLALTYIENHHTSKFFNLTEFYGIDDHALENITEDEVMRYVRTYRKRR